MASGEASEPLKQTCVLKVSIHCEGCKKKVIRVLKKIKGVDDTHVDLKQNKVTVIGNVDAETLVRKLLRANKPAELWPEKKLCNPNPNPNTEPNSSKSNKSNNKVAIKSNEEPKKPSPISEERATAAAPAGKPETAKDRDSAAKPADAAKSSESGGKPAKADALASTEPTKPNPNDSKSSNAAGSSEHAGKPAKADAGAPKSDGATEPTKPNSNGAGSSNPPRDPVSDSAAPDSGENSAGTGGKKEKKKGKKEAGHEPVTEEQRWSVYEHQPHPVHAYNMAHPTMSNSYFTPAPIPPPYAAAQGYTYSHPPPESYYSPYPAYPHVESYYTQIEPGPAAASSSSSGSYDMFSEENANGCKVM